MIKREIVYFFKKLYEMGAITLYEGNISARTACAAKKEKKSGAQEGDSTKSVRTSVWITPSGQSKETLSEDMLVEMGSDGEVVSQNGYAPSSEYRMHLALYALREDVGAIVHTHSAYATAFALKEMPIRSKLAELSIFFGGEIPCCSYGEPGTAEVFADFERYFVDEGKDVVLLARHGVVACAKTVEEAFAKAQTAEKIAKITLLSRTLPL